MTDFDKTLIEKADRFARWDYDDIRVLMRLADTDEARERLRRMRSDMIDLCRETA